jgi:hypothetical protein
MPANLPILIPASLALLTALAFVLKRRQASPPPAVLERIRGNFPSLQKDSLRKPGVAAWLIAGKAEFSYQVEDRNSAGFHHLAAARINRKSQVKYASECMMVVLLLLSKQLEKSGQGMSEIELSLHEPEPGRQEIGFTLTREQQAAWQRQLERDSSAA